jgi:hypothetical protein
MRVFLLFFIPLLVLGFFAGMISPRIAVPWHRKRNRVKVALYYAGGAIAATLFFFYGPSFSTKNTAPIPDLVGRWNGEAPTTYFVWIEKRLLPIDLEIHRDGTITGTIGDATIENGSLWNRETAFVWLGNPVYFGRLTFHGPLIAEEDIVREKGWLFFDLADSVLVCGFMSSGVQAYADKETGVVATGEFILRRPPLEIGIPGQIHTALTDKLGPCVPPSMSETVVFISPRERETIDQQWRDHPNVHLLPFQIREESWGLTAGVVGVPLGILG